MIGYAFATIALLFGLLFFAIAARYYLFTATIFLMHLVSPLRSRKHSGNGGHPNGLGNSKYEGRGPASVQGSPRSCVLVQGAKGNGTNGNNGNNGSMANGYCSEPFVSIQIATYNEPNVIERIISSCMSMDYSNYEVIVVDDSTDRTIEILDRWKGASSLPTSRDGGQVQTLLAYRRPELKIIHRKNRTGFKGGALNEALRHMDPRAEFVIVLDADFVPSPDLIRQFLHHIPLSTIDELFRAVRRLDEDYASGRIGITEYLDKREELLVRTVGRRPTHEIATVGGKVLSQLERLYNSKAIDLETYLERRDAILTTMDLAGVSPLKADPLGERAAIMNTFELDQLFATARIGLAEYMNRRRRHVGQDAIAAKAQSLPFRQIFELDLDFAEGKVKDRDEYLARRAKLVEATLPDENRDQLLKTFELDQSLATGQITSRQYLRELEKLGSNGAENGNGHVGATIWRGHRPSSWRRPNGNGNRHGARRRSNGNGNGLLGGGNGYGHLAAVQGYQWHWLNKSENWLTQGVRAEFSGSYIIERTCQEVYGNMKMVAGSVFMIRADLLRKYGWSTSITEDWELTCRLYRDGYKVAYTPLIQVPAEVPSTVKRLVRQRQRWAEGHTYNAKKYFWSLLRSPNLNLREKTEVLYFAPYYLQSVFFIIGSTFWMLSELTHEYVPFWTALFGWSLLLSNLIALPLMNLAGLYSEGTLKRDFGGVLSTIILSYLLAPFQAFSSLKGLLERREGTWIRTFKTGKITEPIYRLKLSKFWGGTKKKTARTKTDGHGPQRRKGLRRLFRRKRDISTALLVIITATLAIVLYAGYDVPISSGQEIVDNTWSLDKASMSTSIPNNIASAWYRSSTSTGVNYPKNRTWGGAAWGAEVEQSTAGSPIRGVRIAYDPTTYGRYVVAIVQDDGTLDAYVCTTSSCTQNSDLADLWGTAPTAAQRPFDVAFERTSGEAILVYGWWNDATSDLAYRTLAAGASTFGSEILLDDSTTGSEADFSFVVLATRYAGASDYIGLIALQITESDALTAVWDGSSWGSMTDLSTSVGILTEEAVAIAWETSTGDLVAVAGEGTAGNIRFNEYTIAGGWGTSATQDIVAGSFSPVNWLKLNPDVDQTDIMMLVSVDGATDLRTVRWSGSTFDTSVSHDTGIDSNAYRVADFGWEPDGTSTEDGLLIYGTTSGQLTRKEFDAGSWAGSTTNAAYSGTKRWIQAISNPLWESGEMKVLFAVGNSNLDLGAVTWDGTTFTIISESAFTADVNSYTREVFALAYNINPGWHYMRDTSTPSATTLVLSHSIINFISDRTGADRYITSPIPGSTTWTLYLSWSSKSSAGFDLAFEIWTAQGRTLETQVVTGTISLPAGTGSGTANQNVNQPSDVTPAQTPYDVVLRLIIPSGADVTINTGSGGSYLEFSGTLVPERLIGLLTLMPLLPLLFSRHGRSGIVRMVKRSFSEETRFNAKGL